MRFKLKSGKHYWRGSGKERRTLVPGDIIDCDKHQLGNAIDKFDQLDPDPEPLPPPDPEVGLKAVHKGAGWWDVINPLTGKKINDRTLRKEDALRLAGLIVDECPEEDGGEDGEDND